MSLFASLPLLGEHEHRLAGPSDGKVPSDRLDIVRRGSTVLASVKGNSLDKTVNYRIVDYEHVNSLGEKEWRNTDPKGQVTTDGNRTGQGDPDSTTEDIENSDWVNIGFQDEDGEWHYYWTPGPFDSDFWIDDAIEQIVADYGIVLGESI